MTLFSGKENKQDSIEDAQPYFEANNMVNILEKYPEHAALIGNILNSKIIPSTDTSSLIAFEKVKIEQNQIIIKQNEEIISLLKSLGKS